MLPILPIHGSGKKGSAKKKKRPRVLPSAPGSKKKKKVVAERAVVVATAAAAAKEHYGKKRASADVAAAPSAAAAAAAGDDAPSEPLAAAQATTAASSAGADDEASKLPPRRRNNAPDDEAEVVEESARITTANDILRPATTNKPRSRVGSKRGVKAVSATEAAAAKRTASSSSSSSSSSSTAAQKKKTKVMIKKRAFAPVKRPTTRIAAAAAAAAASNNANGNGNGNAPNNASREYRVRHDHQHEHEHDDPTLVLAAEAAAALMDDVYPPHRRDSAMAGDVMVGDDVLGLLDTADVEPHRVEYAATAAASMNDDDDDGDDDGGDDDDDEDYVEDCAEDCAEDSAGKDGDRRGEWPSSPNDSPKAQHPNNDDEAARPDGEKRPKARCKDPAEFGSDDEPVNPLGPPSRVRTFRSEVPASLEMSRAQRAFVRGYYAQDAARENAIGMGLVAGGKRKRGSGIWDDDDDNDEEEEIIVEDDDEEIDNEKDGDKEGGGAQAFKGEENGTPGYAVDKESNEATDLPEAADLKHVTLKGCIAKLRRSTRKRKKVVRNKEDGGDKLLVADPSDAAEAASAEAAASDRVEGDTDAADDDDGKAASNANTSKSKRAEDEEEDVSPQVEIGEDGQIIIAQDSLLVDPTSQKSTDQIDEEFGDNVVEDEEGTAALGAVRASYQSYRHVVKKGKWTVQTTKEFYRALRQCGLDFSLMECYIEGMTRSQLRRKYKAESRKNPRLVDLALHPRSAVKLDLTVFGDKLEIPDEVPTAIIHNVPMKKKEGAGKNGNIKRIKKDGDRDFDALFEDGEGAAKEEDLVEEDYDPRSGMDDGAMLDLTSPSTATKAQRNTNPIGGSLNNDNKATTQQSNKKAKANEKEKEATTVVPAILPLAPVKTRSAKKKKFKVKPKGLKKMKKK